MYLKTLTAVGFKSFADKVELHFPPGVTAIVGPNGCGKSNVSDSIRWVLGEQSAKSLRAGAMADVIFSGTDSRKPLNMSEVSLTFADCESVLGVEYNEVTITRRLFRDGQSEYEMNKTPCRLKDIHQLFMDTGIGRSAYSMMEQGKIDKILSAKPEDRREVFEEAAGITKYKSQKREALRKLEYTEANLLRLTDIIKEVKRQIGSLQRQAGKARRYKELLEQMRSSETRLSRHKYDVLSSEVNRLQSQADNLRFEFEQLSFTLETQEIQISQHRSELELLETKVADARQDHTGIRTRVERGQNLIRVNHERIAEGESLISQYRAEVSAAEEKIKIQQEQLGSIRSMIEENMSGMNLAQETLLQKQSALAHITGELHTKDGQIDAAQREAQTVERKISQLRMQIEQIEGTIQTQGIRREKLSDDQAQLTGQESALKARLTSLEVSTTQAREKTAALTSSITREETALHEAEAHWRSSLESISLQQNELAAARSKLEVLSQMAAEGGSAGTGAQAILSGELAPELSAKVMGTLSSLIEVKSEYVTAIEAALGSALEAVVVDTPETALSLLQVLSTREKGTATLIPVDMIRNMRQEFPGNLPPEAIGWAYQQVTAPESVGTYVYKLLQGYVLTRTLEEAVALHKMFPCLSAVTLAGETVVSPGLMKGGRDRAGTSSLLNRKAHLAEIQVSIQALTAELERRQEAGQSAEAAKKALEERLRELRALLRTEENELATKTSELRQAQREISDFKARSEQMVREVDAAAAQVTESAARQNQLQEQLQSLLEEEARGRETLATLQAEFDAITPREQAAQAEFLDAKVAAATEKQKIEAMQSQCDPIAARLRELAEMISQRETDILRYNEKIDSLRSEIARTEESLAGSDEALARAQSKIDELTAYRKDIHAKVEEADREVRSRRVHQQELNNQRSSVDVQLAQRRIFIDNLREHIQKRYQVNLEEIVLEVQVEGESIEPNWEELEKQVREMQERLDEMGPINIEAITEYDDLETRHTFLNNEYEDLVKAKENILEAINQINKTTHVLFAETFEQIRVNFQQVYVELFGGGKANLILQDENDPLECGIEIVAKPPGKQLQSIQLLSGGEKTMTAVALLFAMYMVKPSPFCVLDEMDAPLDESNINRFLKILTRFKDQSQFVLITHNKRTIGFSDVLYGVTMQESGVSKVVSVKFNHNDPLTGGHAKTLEGEVPSISESMGKPLDVPEPATQM